MAHHPTPRKRHDWEAYETRVVTGNESQTDLARILGVDRSQFNRQWIKREWTRKREEYQKNATAVAKTIQLQTLALDKAAVDDMTDNACRIAGPKLANALTMCDPAEDPKGYAMLLNAVKVMQELSYRALGIAPPKTEIDVNAKVAAMIASVTPADDVAEQIRQRLELRLIDVEGKAV